MNCREARQMIPAWTDRELAPRDAEMLELHLRSCDVCAGLAQREQGFVMALREQLPRDPMPVALKATILGRVAGAQAPAPRVPARAWGWALAASLGFALLLGGLFLGLPGRSAAADWTQFYVEEHQAHNSPASSVQRAAGSPKELAAWFGRSLEQAPHIPTMPDARLLGGRICMVRGKAVGLAVYESQGRTLSLFMGDEGTLCPQGIRQGEGELFSQARPGLSLVAWKHNGHFHVAVSELALPRLQALARECQGIPI
jgi:anti-sigma factor RsiW